MQRFILPTRTALRSTTTRSLHLTRPTFSANSNSESDLTHPALLRDPPAETPTDPWSLTPPPPPPTPTGPAPTMQQLLASPHPEGRDNEQTETLRKRLVYESRKRGILEMDLILGTFAKSRLAELDDGQLREYDRVRFFLSLSSAVGSLLMMIVPFTSSSPFPIGPSSTTSRARLPRRNRGSRVGS